MAAKMGTVKRRYQTGRERAALEVDTGTEVWWTCQRTRFEGSPSGDQGVDKVLAGGSRFGIAGPWFNQG